MRVKRTADGERALVLSKKDRATLARAEEVLMKAGRLLDERFEVLGSDAPSLDRYDWCESLSDAKVHLGSVPHIIRWPEDE